ncbi:thioredoxin peroxidase [Tritrichomonas foetus]|uniref:Thioredoxin peroxidase n=1 Tax=Tritrichomonas foetus TaxID=1144522 RepID=A0A1J4JA07_9EUKA|nr:thioredoxin peroxidase [Tritrichomonas foetus]|eukprot:OHS95992.1 thioredoxin peroxidase [Tritrichomonas foetus]
MSEQGPTLIAGMKCPDFKGQAVFPSLEFKDVELSQFKGHWLVLFTYPLDFTFVCPTEIIQFSKEIEKFKALDCSVIGISTDSVYAHNAWMNVSRKEGGIGIVQYPIIGDLGGVISKKLGFYMEDAGHDLRGTVLVDPDGYVRHVTMNHPDVGRNINEILRLIRGFTATRKNGQVCPAQWDEGSPMINPSPMASKEYFSMVNKK